jgi:hypothetical protein
VTKPNDLLANDVVKKYIWDKIWQFMNGFQTTWKGDFGTIYLSKLESGKKVAVKVLNKFLSEGLFYIFTTCDI